jgi:hypothetical protein
MRILHDVTLAHDIFLGILIPLLHCLPSFLPHEKSGGVLRWRRSWWGVRNRTGALFSGQRVDALRAIEGMRSRHAAT